MPVGTEEELQRAIAQMLKGEFPVEEQTQNTYAKVIVFGMENQEEGNLPDELKEAQVTEVLCAREPERRIAEPGRIIYCAGTYREDLIRMELSLKIIAFALIFEELLLQEHLQLQVQLLLIQKFVSLYLKYSDH